MQAAESSAGIAPGGALADHEITALFQPLAGAQRVALAVSGGADSLALLDCADRWRKASARPDLVVLTVDHKLHPDSGRAAEMVGTIAAGRGLRARVLVREGPPPRADIEAAARAARYRLLFAACREEGATHLVVAHHRDDVAETFLMRLKRGAGIFGLSAMRAQINVGDIVLARPFLGVPRARLAAIVAAAGWNPFDDPMNRDPRFARTAVRKLLAESELDSALIATLAMRFADLADAIDAEATQFITDSVDADAFAVAWLDAAKFTTAPDDVRRRALVRLLLAVGGADYPPRSPRLLALDGAMLADAADARFKRTLAGAVVERRGGRFAFYREAGRTDLPTLLASPGRTVVWDRRFEVGVGEDALGGILLGPLGEEGRRSVGATVGKVAVPAGALAALPALRLGEEIVAVPGFRDGGEAFPARFRGLLGERLATPPRFPDLTGG